MSQDERLMILQMVADKKISASEAAELLKALDAGKEAAPVQQASPTNRVAPTPPPPPAVGEPVPPMAPPPPPTPGVGGGLSSFIEEVVERVTTAFSDSFEPRYEFPTELSGVFTTQEVPLRLFTGNGHVELKAWDQPGYKALVVVKARGSSEEQARRMATEAYTVRADGNGFELEASRRWDWSDLAVHVTLFLPTDKLYRLESRTGNGHILVEGVALRDGQATSGNGRITVQRAVADRLHLRSGNGAIEVEGDIADLDAGTGNGSVRVIPLGRRSEVHTIKTGNGSVTIDSGRLAREVGLKVDANTGMGGVSVNRSDLIYERDVRTMGHKHIIARSQSYDQAERRVEVTARTGLGSVTIE